MMVNVVTAVNFGAIAARNVEAYREFLSRMSADGWREMEANLRDVETRPHSARFLVMRDQGAIVGSVGYYPNIE